MQTLHLAIFSLVNAGASTNPTVAGLAEFAAQWLVFVVPASLLIAWLAGTRTTRRDSIEAGLVACVALALAQVLTYFWYSPRPFAIGIGTQLVEHAADGSFPSDHLTFIWGVAAGLLMSRSTRALGVALAALGVAVAWGRVYVGVHWPIDMLGATLVATAAATSVRLYGGAVSVRLDLLAESVRAVVCGGRAQVAHRVIESTRATGKQKRD
ncbi:undecaprenyl-diphosphatase [Paraburkholderia sp. 40]|uniref:undecaprenyl-diphosphatase n=1 Tax=Paraburkholderia sp. 40 TaxID=2991059 RepID=UPI003D1AB03E